MFNIATAQGDLTEAQQESANWYFNWATQTRRDAFSERYNAIQWSPALSPMAKRLRHAANEYALRIDCAPAYDLMKRTERQIAETGEISDELSEKWSEAKAQIDAPVTRAADLMMEVA